MQSDGKKVSKQEVKWVKVRVDMIWCVCIFLFFQVNKQSNKDTI